MAICHIGLVVILYRSSGVRRPPKAYLLSLLTYVPYRYYIYRYYMAIYHIGLVVILYRPSGVRRPPKAYLLSLLTYMYHIVYGTIWLYAI